MDSKEQAKRDWPVVVESDNQTDKDGNPTGGSVQFKMNGAFGLHHNEIAMLYWQDGPIDYEKGNPNGVTVEALLKASLERLEFYNDSEFRCRENSLAITKIEEALHWLAARRTDRQERGVLGKHEV